MKGEKPHIEDSIEYSQPFDYDAVEGDQDPQAEDMARVASAMGGIMEWIEGGLVKYKMRGQITRMHAFLWCCSANSYGGATQSELARKIGVRVDQFSREVCSFRDTFNFRNSKMRSSINRANSKAAQLKRTEGKPKRGEES